MGHRVFLSVSTMAAIVVVLLLGLLQLAVPGHAQSPPSGSVKLQRLNYSGSGCPSGSAEVAVSSDGKAFTVNVAVLSVSTPGRPADQQKNCEVRIKMSYPAGFMYTLEFVTFSGYVQFEDGVKGSLETGYFFSGAPGETSTLREFPPPSEDNFEVTNKFSTLMYSLCGSDSSTLNINSVARVVSPSPPGNNKAGLITIDWLHFRLGWAEC